MGVECLILDYRSCPHPPRAAVRDVVGDLK